MTDLEHFWWEEQQFLLVNSDSSDHEVKWRSKQLCQQIRIKNQGEEVTSHTDERDNHWIKLLKVIFDWATHVMLRQD